MLHTGLAFVALAHLPYPAPFTILYSGNFFAQGNFSVPCCPAPMPAGAALHQCTQFLLPRPRHSSSLTSGLHHHSSADK